MLERGFDDVSIAEVAEAANVSKMTVSNYFPSKEELILGRIEDHTQEAAQVVRKREPGESPLAALRRHFLERVAANDPFTGLNDDEDTLAFSRLILATPSLELRFVRQQMRAAVSLALAFAEVLGGRSRPRPDARNRRERGDRRPADALDPKPRPRPRRGQREPTAPPGEGRGRSGLRPARGRARLHPARRLIAPPRDRRSGPRSVDGRAAGDVQFGRGDAAG